MRTPTLLLIALCFVFSCSSHGDSNTGNQQEVIIEDQPMLWIGPGFYYGMWFAEEDDYNNWSDHHYQDYRRDHPNGPRNDYRQGRQQGDADGRRNGGQGGHPDGGPRGGGGRSGGGGHGGR